jgi:hypothetical protein
VAGLLLQAVGFGWIALIAEPGLTYPPLILPFVVSGVGIAMTIPAAQSAVLGSVPMTAIGAASGTFNTVRQLGGAFGIAISTAVFTTRGGLGSAKTFSEGFGSAIATAAALAFAGAIIGLLLPNRRGLHRPPVGPGVPRLPVRTGVDARRGAGGLGEGAAAHPMCCRIADRPACQDGSHV